MVVAPIVSAVVKSEDILGQNREWHATRDEHVRLLRDYFPRRAELVHFSEKELRSWASWRAAELNEILARERFDIRLQDFKSGEFGVVAILDVMVEWLARATRTTLRVDGTEYPAVRMEPHAEIESGWAQLFEAYGSPAHPHPVALLHTKSGDRVYMTVAGTPPGADFELIDRVDAIRTTLGRASGHYTWLEFPMIDLNQQVDITWLLGMWTTVAESGQEAFISQALQQTKFKMNEVGARVKSAVAIGIIITSIRLETPLIIDQPFFLWIERNGVSAPVLYAYLDYADWKDPGDLSNM